MNGTTADEPSQAVRRRPAVISADFSESADVSYVSRLAKALGAIAEAVARRVAGATI